MIENETIRAGFVNGRWVDGSGPTVNSVSPSCGDDVWVFRESHAQLVENAMESARAAAAGWSATPAEERALVLQHGADRLAATQSDLVAATVCEVGKPIREAREEVARSIALLRFHIAAALDPHGETFPAPDGRGFSYSVHRPLGSVALITPWNFPIAIPLWKIAPALAYGNTVIVKPAPAASRVAAHIANAFDHLPSGVLNVVFGGPEVGTALVAGNLEGVSFTGSTSVGRQLLSVLPPTTRYQAELGGKNAAVVLDDADLEFAAATITAAATGFAGQKCTAASRVIVQESVRGTFTELLTESFREVSVGDPRAEDTTMGPLISSEAVDRVAGFVNRAISDGARLCFGGHALPDLGDAYFAPTLFDQVDPRSELAEIEVFGPVLSMFSVESYDDAVRLVNSSQYGLAASIFTRSLEYGTRFADDVAVGVVRVNGPTPGLLYNAPFAPAGDSGIGLPEQGKAARDFYTRVQTVTIAAPQSIGHVAVVSG